MFETVLIANRGEIACRVIDTLRALGIRSVAVFSDADAGARHVQMADVAVRLGAAAAADSYLHIDKIVRAALDHGAQAIHPGYGFLAENAAFAQACSAAGIVFIGPSVEALTVMGDKISAKAQVTKRGVPVVPGVAEPGMTDQQLIDAAPGIGFPVLIKPSAGGGGKGMHLVEEASALPQAVAAARREAASSFGDDSLFIERFISRPRHIEVQVLADADGTTVHLGERECSLQRRHQKVIEEAPSPLLDDETRQRIGQAAVDTALSVGYLGAGTVEFIVSADAPDEFFFMEMNTRLQVEHPVTEMVTGIDLVEWQLRIAAGERLDFDQSAVRLTGHAIEARVYAEDPQHGFLPTGGHVLALQQPEGEGIRVDSALVDGPAVASDYDPMLAKVIAWAPSRGAALRRLRRALADTVTLGVTTNVEFLQLLIDDPDVIAGDLDTELIARRLDGLAFRPVDATIAAAGALVLHALSFAQAGPAAWQQPAGWRLGDAAAAVYRLAAADAEPLVVRVTGTPSAASITVDAGSPLPASVTLDSSQGIAVARVRLDGVVTTFRFARDGDVLHLEQGGAVWSLTDTGLVRAAAHGSVESPTLRSPMPGAVVAVFVSDGQRVDEGDPVLSIEAMKMEHVLRAPHAGTVALGVELGAQVAANEVVATIEAEQESDPADDEDGTP
ncbi:biotin carboxylase N-terminal domain-containing protein [Salinibacterium sp. G-O1]|uniref:ATP-binding protein n=1 Tax=Salinibacterium sp. G-O1 TaxID=3046208 RepID=UPI0024B8E9C8|nr:biotin carboxylase N-terminal domain-containing protein [Salinibacterium sp. G-O1]MDJ0333864.1 biotin carboxylase N-terminal domain-containing protein [Salinibacterium sp. G-O1]